jgi:hypothetical protein
MMHLLELHFENARENGDGRVCLSRDDHELPKWSLLPAGLAGQERLRLVAIACGGVRLFPQLPFALTQLCLRPAKRLQVEVLLALHPLHASQTQNTGLWGSGVSVDERNMLRRLAREEYHFLSSLVPQHRAKTGMGDSWLFLLGYGPEPRPHDGTDDFDFTDPCFRRTRFYSLFLDEVPLTDPVAFLTMTHCRGVRWQRRGARYAMERLSLLIKTHLGIDTGRWLGKNCDFREQWRDLAPWQQRALLPAVDAARHLLDAYPKEHKPLDLPGLILFDRPDRCCPDEHFAHWAMFMDALLPKMQFLVTLGEDTGQGFPAELRAKTLALPSLKERPHPRIRAPQGGILLVDVDSRLPNLALMKVSRYFKNQGRRVILARGQEIVRGVEAAYASAVFAWPTTANRVKRLRDYYGDALIIGGSGVDLGKRLPAEMEGVPADYSLYPALGDRAMGFLTRGCPFACPFCVVPLKEGAPRQVANLDELLTNGQRKLLLLDDNILAHPKAGDLLEEMAARELMVNFTQTLDLRLLDKEKVCLVKRIHCSNLRFTRRVVHFSLNDNRNLEEVREKYDLFGFSRRDNVEFVCMYGFDTTLAEDVDRFRFLHSLPGAYVFVQKYMPILGGPPPKLAKFFDDRADQFLDELIRIVFTQNMKSMENYYRWVSNRFSLTFGRIHQGLVDTIFRYNDRERKGLYLEALATLCERKNRK